MVILTEHARQRWRERGGEGELTAAMVRRHLLGKLPSGLDVQDMVVHVPLGGGLVAVCRPETAGFWIVLTVERQELPRLLPHLEFVTEKYQLGSLREIIHNMPREWWPRDDRECAAALKEVVDLYFTLKGQKQCSG